MATDQDTGAVRRVIIHCGAQKTASTSLQNYLNRNSAALAGDLEIVRPEKGSDVQQLGRKAMQYSLNPSAELKSQLVAAAHAVRDQLLTGRRPVIISHENLMGAMLGKGGTVTLYPRLEQIIDLLNTHLAPLVPEFVVYTREMSVWKLSVYNQAVQTDRYTYSCDRFLKETANCGSWDDLYQRLAAVLGLDRLRMFALEDEPNDDHPGTQLLLYAGLSESDIAALEPQVRRSKQSLGSASALEFIRQLNELRLDRTVHARIVDLVRTNPSLFATGGT